MHYLKVKNLERYQHYKHRNPPWVKLYREAWTDYTLRACSVPERLLFFGLTTLGMELGNQIPNDPKYLSSRLGFAITTRMIVHLLSSNLLLSNLEEQVASIQGASEMLAESKHVASTRPEDWLATIRANPAYAHLSLDTELAKMDAWLSTKPGRKKTKSFVVNWLNKIEPPLPNSGGKQRPPPFPPKTDPIARGQWRTAYGDPAKYGYE